MICVLVAESNGMGIVVTMIVTIEITHGQSVILAPAKTPSVLSVALRLKCKACQRLVVSYITRVSTGKPFRCRSRFSRDTGVRGKGEVTDGPT